MVRRKLAEGGMAELYLCSSRGPEGFEKEVVIKRIRPFMASDPEFIRMFIAEARLASRLNHPNLVQIFDFDKHEDTYYLAMEHVRGHSLSEVRKRCKARMIAMRPVLIAHIGAEVARGLHHAHRLTENGAALGLVHRDVTPHNVLLSFDGAVKLTDFGIAKANDKLTSPGRLKGKLAYMSPEQSRGEPVDARTDVFALGIVLWEMMTGGRLFEGDGDMAVLQSVQGSAIASVARVNPDVPLDLDAAVMKALARNREARHQTAQELERALAQCVLSHARTLEDTDVAGFLRMLFEDECSSPPNHSPASRGDLPDGAKARQSQTTARLPTEATGPRNHPPLPRAAGRALGARSARLTLKIGLGAAALAVLIAAGLHFARSRKANLLASAAAGEPQVQSMAGAQVAPASPDGPAAEPPSPIFSRAGGAKLEQSPENSQTGQGTLVLKIAPWAFLSIDGKSRGEVSGVRRYRLPSGKHHLRLSHPRGSKEVDILLRDGERVVEQYQLFSHPR